MKNIYIECICEWTCIGNIRGARCWNLNAWSSTWCERDRANVNGGRDRKLPPPACSEKSDADRAGWWETFDRYTEVPVVTGLVGLLNWSVTRMTDDMTCMNFMTSPQTCWLTLRVIRRRLRVIQLWLHVTGEIVVLFYPLTERFKLDAWLTQNVCSPA